MLKAEIYIDEDELIRAEPLHDYIMKFLLDQGITGATNFTGYSGFGRHQKVKKPNRPFSFDDTPMVIVFIDEEERVRKAIKELRNHFKGGVIITQPVDQW